MTTGMNKVMFLNGEKMQRAIALNFVAGIPTALIGGVGSGKTSGVNDFVENMNKAAKVASKIERKWRLSDPNLSTVGNEDVGGIPFPHADGKHIEYRMLELLPFDCDDHVIIFGDEFDRAKEDVQNAFLNILLGRKLHGHILSKNAHVILAMNGTSDMFTTPLSKAAANRVCSLFVSSSAEGAIDSYDSWADRNGISPLIRGFARFRPELMQCFDEFEEIAIPTPRSRDMAAKILEAADKVKFNTSDILLPCLAGVIGKAAAVELMAYREQFLKCPDPLTIIADPQNAPIPALGDASIFYALGIALIYHTKAGDRVTAQKVVQYSIRLPDETCAFILRKIIDKVPNVITTAEYMKWANDHKALIMP